MAEDTWSHLEGELLETDTLKQRITATPALEGVTFLGGEPFEQAEAVASLASYARTIGLSVVTFTGFTLSELRASSNASVLALLNTTDLLIDGAFKQEHFDLSRPWVGSSNQGYHFLTDRYKSSELQGITNQVEARIAPDGSVLINGMGDFAKLKTLV
jgi:anaerobic ribonucleoside-triphosphate reductase activating protein